MAAKLPRVQVGDVFGRLTVSGEPYKNKNNIHAPCLCVCGTSIVAQQPALRSGNTTSCGCFRKEVTAARSITHGMSCTKVYRLWSDMVQRVTNPNTSNYSFYGGRGIKLEPRWVLFDAFFSDMGDMPSADHSIERLDSNGDYNKDNCVWATTEEQNNNRRSSVRYPYLGQNYTVKELAVMAGTTEGAMLHRLNTHSVEVALSLKANSKAEFYAAGTAAPAVKHKLYE
jgi:hypothetical protein